MLGVRVAPAETGMTVIMTTADPKILLHIIPCEVNYTCNVKYCDIKASKQEVTL